jgi:hypothetical protein
LTIPLDKLEKVMARPEAQDLILKIQEADSDSFRSIEQKNLITNYSHLEIQEAFQKVVETIPEKAIEPLRHGMKSAYLGALYAFRDRELDPFHPDHIYIFPLLCKDIEEAFLFISQGEVDEKLWEFETFDYGIKQVYYLDWQLYLSKICY